MDREPYIPMHSTHAHMRQVLRATLDMRTTACERIVAACQNTDREAYLAGMALHASAARIARAYRIGA